MPSETGNPFDGAFPPVFPPEDGETYDDLLSPQNLNANRDMPMPDVQETRPSDISARGYEAATKIKTEEPDTEFLWAAMREHSIELTDSNSDSDDENGDQVYNSGGRTQPQSAVGGEGLTASETSDRIRALLNGNSKDLEEIPARPGTWSQRKTPSKAVQDSSIPVKKEAPDFIPFSKMFPTDEVINITDTDDDVQVVSSKAGGSTRYKHGTTMANGTVLLSDSEDGPEEIIVYDDGSTAVTMKQENPEVEFLGANKSLVELPESESSSEEEPVAAPKPNLGNSMLRRPNPKAKRTPMDFAKMQEIQRLYAARALGRAVPTGASAMFKTPKPTAPASSRPDSGTDEFAWMSDTVVLDENSGSEFQAVKQKYRAKKKTRKNTWEDDVEFKKAQDKENIRINRLVREAQDSEDEAEDGDNSEDDLFYSSRQSRPPKRPLDTTFDDDDDGDNEAGLADEQNGKRAKPHKPSKIKRKNFFEKELRMNELQGIEALLYRERKKAKDAEGEAAEKVTKKPQGNGGKGKKISRKVKPIPKRSKVTKTGATTDIGSLITSNVYEDSNANLGSRVAPVMSEKKKREALTSLVASVPIDEKKKATTDMREIQRATILLGAGKVLPDGKGDWAFKGMKSSLYHYQVQGAARMKERETGTHQPLGGMLADEMGLGKTVMTIAAIIANRPPPDDEYRCTLIVCSPALLTQWEDELFKHIDDTIFPRIVRHHSGTKVAGKGAVLELERANIVLTTYQEVVRSYPKCDIPKDIKDLDAKQEWWHKEWDTKRELLHRGQFYRIVLDAATEAQAIKNHRSQTSIACRALMAKHRWAISGTPIQNRLEELFPYFKFLRVSHTGSFDVFQQNFCLKGSTDCNGRLHALLDQMMIRRTYKDKTFGVPLVQLPKNTVHTEKLSFNPVEKRIYDMVRMRCVRAINRFARQGTVEEHLKMLMTMFQRLRQMTAHIMMVQEIMEKEYELDDIGDLWEDLVADTGEGDNIEKDMMTAIWRMIKVKEDPTEAQNPQETPNINVNNQGSQPRASLPKKENTLASKFARVLRDLRKEGRWTELRDMTLCTICKEPPEEPLVTSCLHVYCRECLSNMAYEASRNDQDRTACEKCKKPFTTSESCEGLKELDVEDLTDKIAEEGSKKKPFKLTMDYVDHEDKILLSTKTTAVIKLLEQWIKDNPDRKIIVFSEWHLVFHVLARICQQKKWKYCLYNGKMSHKNRDKTLAEFKSMPDITIMIASLKCGGQGLNLTVASKVICVDLWFNSCVEQQAFCRVFRIGQTEETYITRFMVEGTVDAKLIEMQETKKEIISAAMDDREVLSKLSLDEVMRLFGEVAYDQNSKPFILVDDEEELRSKKPPRPGA